MQLLTIYYLEAMRVRDYSARRVTKREYPSSAYDIPMTLSISDKFDLSTCAAAGLSTVGMKSFRFSAS